MRRKHRRDLLLLLLLGVVRQVDDRGVGVLGARRRVGLARGLDRDGRGSGRRGLDPLGVAVHRRPGLGRGRQHGTVLGPGGTQELETLAVLPRDRGLRRAAGGDLRLRLGLEHREERVVEARVGDDDQVGTELLAPDREASLLDHPVDVVDRDEPLAHPGTLRTDDREGVALVGLARIRERRLLDALEFEDVADIDPAEPEGGLSDPLGEGAVRHELTPVGQDDAERALHDDGGLGLAGRRVERVAHALARPLEGVVARGAQLLVLGGELLVAGGERLAEVGVLLARGDPAGPETLVLGDEALLLVEVDDDHARQVELVVPERRAGELDARELDRLLEAIRVDDDLLALVARGVLRAHVGPSFRSRPGLAEHATHDCGAICS